MIQLTIRLPDQLFLNESVPFVILPAADGLYGIYPKHAPLLLKLKSGVVRYGEKTIKIKEGFAEIGGDHVECLVTGIEK